MNIWYENLVKPPLTPSPVYFSVAWSILYALMFLALVLVVFGKKSEYKNFAVLLFSIQLFFNIIWNYLFFTMQAVRLALLDVVLIFIFLIITLYCFFKISKLAGILLLPYLLQVIFAIYLTSGILMLNY